ncbi:MAG TPA: PAS domain-containing protein, partial [Cryomorphaceae bacterium]|nr:PAS domain-containing protein [Cryomorphaceae bacterium]
MDYLDLILKALNHTDVGVSLADYQKPDLPLIYINQGFTEMTGYSSDEVLGKNCRFLQGRNSNT